MREKFEEFNKNLDKHFAKQNDYFKEFNKNLDEHFNKQNEQFTLLHTDICEHTNTWNNNKNEVEKKQDEEVNKSHEEVRKVRDNDNAVDFTDVLATKKLATVGSNVSVVSRETGGLRKEMILFLCT